jgi:hypothetical protein
MASDDSTAVPDPEVVCTPLRNGEGVLLHLGTQCYFTLNETGLMVWRLMEQGLKLGAIGDELTARFRVSGPQASQHVLDLADQLLAERLISLVDRPTGASDTGASR